MNRSAAETEHERHQRHEPRFVKRLLSWRVGAMLARNTMVASSTFLVGLGVLWLLVSQGGVNKIVATAISFLVANAMHYMISRVWVYVGSRRAMGSGYLFFLVNSAIGLTITTGLFALLIHHTEINYLLARVIVSVFAGLAMFVLNAALNFRLV